MSIYATLQSTGLPCAYGFFKTPQEPPYLVYIGAGQDQFIADNKIYYGQNTYQIEYYFTEKNEANEAAIEAAFTTAGLIYTKSEDIYIESENVFVIYYYI